jgi:hypothetical protein
MSAKRKPYIFSIYDSEDNDTLVYSGSLEGAADFLKIQKKSVYQRAKVPYVEQKSRFKLILEGYDAEEPDESEEIQNLKEEIERLNEELGIVRTCYLNELTSDKTVTEIKKYIMQLRLYEVRDLKNWLDNVLGEKEE